MPGAVSYWQAGAATPFLLRQFLLDITRSRTDARRRAWVESGYVVVSLLAYAYLLWRTGPRQ